MKNKNTGMIILAAVVVLALAGFLALYIDSLITVEEPWEEQEAESSLEDWTVEESAANGQPLRENQNIYEPDNAIYDVYISVFPTKDENGEMLDFSAFDLHKGLDHSYNPTLNCNIQFLPQDGKLDPLINLDDTNATIRVRGNSARAAEYKSYKIKLQGDYFDFQGQTTLNINKHAKDYSKVTAKFCSDVTMQVPNLPGYRTNFMRLWIRDTSLPKEEQTFRYYGLYTHTEQPNKKYLEARGLSSNCSLYKARDFSFKSAPEICDVDDPHYSEQDFERVMGIREGKDHQKLLQLLEVCNDPTISIEELMHTYFNEDNYLTWLAFNILVGADDILNHNYLLYNPDNSMTWYFIPWDMDANMQFRPDEKPVSLRAGQNLNQVSVHRRYFQESGNLEKLDNKMQELMAGPLSQENVSSLVEGYLPVLEQIYPLEPDLGLLRMTPQETLEKLKSYPQMVQDNYHLFLQAFQYPSPMFVAMPQRNENGTIHLSWDPSYSYQGRTVTYRVQLANDCHMQNILFEQKDLITTELDADVDLEPGTYYLKVFAKDSEGNEQIALEHYEFAGATFIYEPGVLEFKLP